MNKKSSNEVIYKNRKNVIYYLCEGKSKTGKNKYYFTSKNTGKLVEKIPDGYEIYEHPNAQVFLRKVTSHYFTDCEILTIEEGILIYPKVKNCKSDIRNKEIIIYTPDNSELFEYDFIFKIILEKGSPDIRNYSPMMRIKLMDQKNRTFRIERWCFLGSIDRWIVLDYSDDLSNLVKKYFSHLGNESFYELI
jgi:hypothetical protein